MQVEAELTELPTDDRVEYLQSLGVGESGLGNLIRATYNLLGLRTYFTSGEKVLGIIIILFLLKLRFISLSSIVISYFFVQETKAWTILAG